MQRHDEIEGTRHSGPGRHRAGMAARVDRAAAPRVADRVELPHEVNGIHKKRNRLHEWPPGVQPNRAATRGTIADGAMLYW